MFGAKMLFSKKSTKSAATTTTPNNANLDKHNKERHTPDTADASPEDEVRWKDGSNAGELRKMAGLPFSSSQALFTAHDDDDDDTQEGASFAANCQPRQSLKRRRTKLDNTRRLSWSDEAVSPVPTTTQASSHHHHVTKSVHKTPRAGVADFTTLLQQLETPSPSEHLLSHEETTVGQGPQRIVSNTSPSPFASLDLSVDDLVAMEALVEQTTATSSAAESTSSETADLLPNVLAATTNTPGVSAPTTATLPSTDDFPDLDLDALEQCLAEATQSSTTSHSTTTQYTTQISHDAPVSFARYQVTAIARHDGQVVVTTNEMGHQIILRDQWYHTQIQLGDALHLVRVWVPGKNSTTIPSPVVWPVVLQSSNQNNNHARFEFLVIVHPHILVTPTNLTESLTCLRRSVWNGRVGSTGWNDKAPLLGTLRHELLNLVLWNEGTVVDDDTLIDRVVRTHAEDMLSCRLSTAEAKRELAHFVVSLQSFVQEYTNWKMRNNRGTMLLSDMAPAVRFCAQRILAMEEPIVSPILGLKGTVDMIVEGSIDNTSHRTVGVELKTGHKQDTNSSHAAQLILYMLLLQTHYYDAEEAKRYGSDADSGLLLYMNGQQTRGVHVVPEWSHVANLMIQRNEVAHILRQAAMIPTVEGKEQNINHILGTAPTLPPLANAGQCRHCYRQRECMTFTKADMMMDGIEDAEHSHSELMHQYTGHLSSVDMAYLSKWSRLIDIETKATESFLPDAWLVESSVREKETSNCISSLRFVLDEGSSNGDDRVLLSFQRDPAAALQTPLFSLSIGPDAHVIISVDRCTAESSLISGKHLPRMHVVRGMVHTVSQNSITIHGSIADQKRLKRLTTKGNNLFRIDRDDSAKGMGTMRQNLLNLLALNGPVPLPRQVALREVVVHNKTATFSQVGDMFSPRSVPILPGCDLFDLSCEFAELNSDQLAAAKRVVSMDRYCLIQGFPGTGKSSIITFVARLLAAQGKRVLISAYTNAAVDNIMMKLMNKGVAETNGGRKTPALVRIGKKSSCDPCVRPILIPEAAKAIEPPCQHDFGPYVESLRNTVKAARIVGVSALSATRSPFLQGEDFDVVIVDEAGQISQPAVLGPLLSADSFVLVGDHMQLPPLTVSDLAIEGGFSVSLMKQLADSHPESVSQLTLQYRMNEEICQLGNDIVYNGKLHCATDKVARQRLDLPGFPENLSSASNSWLSFAVDPCNPVLFLDTDELRSGSTDDNKSFHERTAGRSARGNIVNDVEADVVGKLVDALIRCGLGPKCIGIISPFRAQVSLLNKHANLNRFKALGLEISTVDRYQGRDKPVMILSFVRSNQDGQAGRLLQDVRRLNVALTRAKCKLILVGSFSTLLQGSPPLRPVLERVEGNQRLITLS